MMYFIDGGYLRARITNAGGDSEHVDYDTLRGVIVRKIVLYWIPNLSQGDRPLTSIRWYLYDGMPDPDAADRRAAEERLRRVHRFPSIEVRLGRLKACDRGGRRQKGVDTLIALDMVSKAYQDQYDVAVLLAGDDDFLDIVRSVKDAGKRVFGVFCEAHVSDDLRDSFDLRFPIDEEIDKNTFLRPMREVPDVPGWGYDTM